jgi:TonB family protein
MRQLANLVAVVSVLLALLSGIAPGQTAPNHTERKVIVRIAPVYPELAKRTHIAGVVKLEVVVRPNGSVKSTRPVGGNPVLVQATTDAVLKWKFEVAPQETTGIVEVMFDPEQSE